MTNQHVVGNNTRQLAQTSRWSRNWARYLNALLGAWLILSVFAWEHSAEARLNSLLVGAVTLITALTARSMRHARAVSVIAGIWLVIAARIIHTPSTLTAWNNIAVGILVFAFSLAPAYASSPLRGE